MPAVYDFIGWEEGVKEEKKKDDGTLLWLIIGIVGSFCFMWMCGWGPKNSPNSPEGVGLESDRPEWLTVKFTGDIFEENPDTTSDDTIPLKTEPAVIRQNIAELIEARGLLQLREGPATEELLEISISQYGFVNLDYSRPLWYRANGESYQMRKSTWSKSCGMEALIFPDFEAEVKPDAWPPTEECLTAFIDEYLKANER